MSVPTGFDAVLASAPPVFDDPEVLAIAASTFDLRASGVRNLGSERDQTFLLTGPDATPLAVMKVSNSAEDPAILDMEALAVRHAAQVDPGLPLALPWAVPGVEPITDPADDDPARYRATIAAGDGSHQVRMYDVLVGRQRIRPTELSDVAVGAWGATTARLGLALRGFFHPRSRRTMLWDVQHTARTRALLGSIRDPRQRALVEQALDRFEAVVTPVWTSLRAQVVHSDLTVDNALTDDAGRISGIVDFGDMSYSALVTDLASVLDSLVVDRGPDEVFRLGRLVLDGYQRVVPLEPLELRLMGELLAARAAVTIAISSWRSELGLEERTFAERYNASVAATLETLIGVGWAEAARRFGADAEPGRAAELVARRRAALGSAIEPLSYRQPIHVASASGVWLTDVEGRRFLDAYNNVPCVGHGHPRVTEAIARQARRLNTNMRYLHGAAIELAERLAATMPDGLDTVLFVNSGSEANDLAWRLATTFTGNDGALCTGYAYHGITEASAALSPESWRGRRRPDHVETWVPPDPLRGMDAGTDGFSAAVGRLADRGRRPAATILDGVLTSDGYPDPPAAYVRELVRLTHAAGGLWIADEVQGGHGRTGTAMWSFERFGIVPDLVTLGKPMGNGHPVGAVITRRDIAERFGDETVFFSTFGGNQVSVAAAMAVLDVLEDECILDRVIEASAALRLALSGLAERYPSMAEVRGAGLAVGVDIVRDPTTMAPDAALAEAIKEGLRDRGVLIGTTGPLGNVLKIRPPLAFTAADVPSLVDPLAETLQVVAAPSA
ncbi:MAG TPA: aminotransferase class III-fold pyridoxal phosphate-dependent enzyme [Candidatus Limnocylindrales bacterium]|nr:aminotransferase class III-fold pyridoxal phosphate-dependent enzyme [Candidatus Limnocylindrales bacterium]